MRLTSAALAVALAFSLSAQSPSADPVFNAALENLPQELRAVGNDPVRNAPKAAVAVARRTIGGAADEHRSFVEAHFGTVIAEDLLAAYGASGPEARFIEADSVRGLAVLPLENFEAGQYAYDWQRLRAEYPDVRYVIRLTAPAVDRLSSYATVRYEVIGVDGPHFATMVKFERQNDGSWKPGVHRVGSLRR